VIVAVRLSSWFLRPSVLGALFTELRLAWRLMKEPRVSVLVKVVPALALVYVLSPLDFIPDVMPFLGQVDDIGILVLALKGFLKLCPHAAHTHHAAAISSGRRYAPMTPSDIVIDASYRRD
jgi:uncharacterized membrane protein YkvA (DUF1232 family)